MCYEIIEWRILSVGGADPDEEKAPELRHYVAKIARDEVEAGCTRSRARGLIEAADVITVGGLPVGASAGAGGGPTGPTQPPKARGPVPTGGEGDEGPQPP